MAEFNESSALGRPGIATPAALVTNTSTRSGLVIGTGVETQLWGNWIGGVEYLYFDTGTFTTGTFGRVAAGDPLNFPGGVPVGTTGTMTERLQNNIVRVRLDYKF